jgi:hypothetical protein
VERRAMGKLEQIENLLTELSRAENGAGASARRP